MDKLFIVANLKSNQTNSEAKDWLLNFRKIKDSKQNFDDKEIILCPSLILLSTFALFISENNLNIRLGAQNVSPFNEGPYTGEVNAKQVKDFADYVLIGHSERRTNFSESDEMLSKKVEACLKYGLKPIFFVQDTKTFIPHEAQTIVYEPPSSISTVSNGIPDSPEDVELSIKTIGKNRSFEHIFYGASVDSNNVSKFTSIPKIDGVVVGKASLDAQEFIKIIENA